MLTVSPDISLSFDGMLVVAVYCTFTLIAPPMEASLDVVVFHVSSRFHLFHHTLHVEVSIRCTLSLSTLTERQSA